MNEHELAQEDQDAQPAEQQWLAEAPEPPTPLEKPPETDIDTWFAQRDEMIEKLRARRESLLEELRTTREALIEKVQETERRLAVLGITVESAVEEEQEEETPASAPAPRSRKKRARAAAAAPAPQSTRRANPVLDERTAALFQVMTKKPEKVSDIAKRAGMSYNDGWRVLTNALKAKKVKRTMVGRETHWSLA